MGDAIQLEGLIKEYPGSDRKIFRAVDGLNLSVQKGEILAFLGPNGAGKTTTIKMILGLVRPDAGRISVLGLDVERQRYEVLRRVGAVLEGNRNIYWDLTVLENMRYWGTLKEVPAATLKRRIPELLGFFDLEEKLHVIGKQLSRGMQQKLAIACSLIHDPEIILLDEPTLGLDVQAARMVKERVLQLSREQGRTVVLTTHQLDVAQELCERVAIITKGQLRALDQKENLIQMFSQQEYEFKISGPLPEAALAQFGTVIPGERNGVSGFRILLQENQALYGVMEALREAGTQVLAVNKKEADLEEIFVHITEGKGSTEASAEGAAAKSAAPAKGVAANA
ncbi:MAG: ABC transporter ATP-binding protein [Bacillota bacterium]